MNSISRYLLLCCFLFPTQAFTSQDKEIPADEIVLICEYTNSLKASDSGVESEKISGNITIRILLFKQPSRTVFFDADGKQFFGKQFSDSFQGSYKSELDESTNIAMRIDYFINRYTGELKQVFYINNDFGMSLHADCKKATKKDSEFSN